MARLAPPLPVIAQVRVLTRKHSGWSYEKEWRLIHRQGANSLMSFRSESLVGIIFGSRANGNFSPGSDIDLAVKGNLPDFRMVEKLRNMLENGLYLPYFFDIIDYGDIKEPALKAHIDRVGKVFYKKTMEEAQPA